MTPEQYLRKLTYGSRFGPLVLSPHSEMRKAHEILLKTLVARFSDIPLDQVPDFPKDETLVDRKLRAIRDHLLPFFPTACRDKIQAAPIGMSYNLDMAGFAARVPGGAGHVVCIDTSLDVLLHLCNWCTHMDTPGHQDPDNLCGYTAIKCLHFIYGVAGRIMPSMLPKVRRDTKIVVAQAGNVGLVQLNFIVAHEYSHICLGHTDTKPADQWDGINKAHELEADEAAARVLLARDLARTGPKCMDDLELNLGAIAAIFYASEAILCCNHGKNSFTRSYPTPESRFDQVIEVYRQHYGRQLTGAIQYLRPFMLIRHLFDLLDRNPLEAVQWFSEIALICTKFEDFDEELFALAMAREAAAKGGDTLLRETISNTIDEGIAENTGPLSVQYGKAVTNFQI